MAALQDKIAVPRGAAFQINRNAITSPGTIDFTLPRLPGASEFSGFFECGGTVTTLTASLQIALDGQSFQDYIVAANFISAAAKQKVFSPTSSTPMIAGATYSLNITAASGSFSIFVGFNSAPRFPVPPTPNHCGMQFEPRHLRLHPPVDPKHN